MFSIHLQPQLLVNSILKHNLYRRTVKQVKKPTIMSIQNYKPL